MSSRDTYWFIAGAASGLMVGALGVYLLVGAPAAGRIAAADSAAVQTNTADPALLMPGDRWPTLADADSTGTVPSDSKDAGSATDTPGPTGAGSLDTVTRNLAQRLATKGGTDDEWRLLAQSYEFMGRADEARAARKHVTKPSSGQEAVPLNPAGSRVFGTVQIDDTLASLAPSGTTLFIYATDADSPGPPLAVLRLKVEHWPVTFVLDDADAMIPGRNLSSVKSVQLEARISPRGEALPSPGDLVGSLDAVDPHNQHAVNISIDRKITG